MISKFDGKYSSQQKLMCRSEKVFTLIVNQIERIYSILGVDIEFPGCDVADIRRYLKSSIRR